MNLDFLCEAGSEIAATSTTFLEVIARTLELVAQNIAETLKEHQ